MKLARLALFSLAALLVLAGCGDDAVSLDPPDINFGVDMAEMGMPVVDPRFTVAALPSDSQEWVLFDDVGEFLRYNQIKSSDFKAVWLPDHDTEEWIKPEDAWFVQSNEFCYSPMKWCVAVFSSEDVARDKQSQFGGEIWSWDNVLDATWSSAPAPGELDSQATPRSGN